MVTSRFKLHAALCRSLTGVDASEYSARSLRAGGAMALLCGRVDDCTIKLLARWNSDSMMDYLHQQARPVFDHLAEKMFNKGTYSFLPTDFVPSSS